MNDVSRDRVRIIGVPMDLGGGRRGVDMGPSAIRISRLHGHLGQLGLKLEDSGNLEVPGAEQVHYGHREAKYLKQVNSVCRRLARRAQSSLEADYFPLVLGGDHSITAGTVSGVSGYYRRSGQKIGLIWIDAHPDMNTPSTSPSGNVHGMPLAALLGIGPEVLATIGDFQPKVAIENAVVVGARSIDSKERETIQECGLRVISMSEIDRGGLVAAMEQALALANAGTVGFHCSLDLDVVDPPIAPGVGSPVPGGISYRESHLAMEMIYDWGGCVSLDVVEVNPILDSENRTGNLAVELICSAFGKKIL